MQTFLTDLDFAKTARQLDSKRLGKQRVEAWQIFQAIRNGTGWKNHPCVKMWAGYTKLLLCYQGFICDEWVRRGYKQTMFQGNSAVTLSDSDIPYWIKDESVFETLITSHKSNLIRKDSKFYVPKFGNLRADLPYYWPESSPEKAYFGPKQ